MARMIERLFHVQKIKKKKKLIEYIVLSLKKEQMCNNSLINRPWFNAIILKQLINDNYTW